MNYCITVEIPDNWDSMSEDELRNHMDQEFKKQTDRIIEQLAEAEHINNLISEIIK